MAFDIWSKAVAQYDDWIGTLAGDKGYTHDWENLLGIDGDKWQLVRLEITFAGGFQQIQPYAISINTPISSLQERVALNETIFVHKLDSIESRHPGHFDLASPPAEDLPLVVPLDFLKYAFKDLQIVLVSRHIPKNGNYELADADS